MENQASRQIILEYFALHSQASSLELSRELGITLAGVRYHLAQLMKQGVIEPVPVEGGEQARPGRPHKSYRLKPANRPNNLSELLQALLDRLEPAETTARAGFWEALADALAPETARSPSLSPRQLIQSVAFLNQRSYQARWEAHRQGPRIVFHNCPYALVWPKHTALCRMDARLLALLCGAAVEQVANLHESPTALGTCIFQLFPVPREDAKM